MNEEFSNGVLQIGNLEIEGDNENVWITVINDGEGGQFNARKLFEVINRFYTENF